MGVGRILVQAQEMLPDCIRQTRTKMYGGVSGDDAERFDLHIREERPDGLQRGAVLQGHTRQPGETVVQRDRFRGADQPGVFVPPTMLVLSSQAGWFREQVAGPRDCCANGPCCSESSSVR